MELLSGLPRKVLKKLTEKNFEYDDIESFMKFFPGKSQDAIEHALYKLRDNKYISCAPGDDTVIAVIVLPKGKEYFSCEKPSIAKDFFKKLFELILGKF